MEEKTLRTRSIYQGRLVDFEVIDIALPDGTTSFREVVRHPGAVAVLARREDGCFLLVRQYRKPVEQALLEIIAGTLEEGEDPAVCAAREVWEETGARLKRLVPLGPIYPTPGYVSERIEVFFADVQGGGVPQDLDEDERIEVCPMTRDEVLAALTQGELVDSKTLAAWLLYEHRVAGPAGEDKHG